MPDYTKRTCITLLFIHYLFLSIDSHVQGSYTTEHLGFRKGITSLAE